MTNIIETIIVARDQASGSIKKVTKTVQEFSGQTAKTTTMVGTSMKNLKTSIEKTTKGLRTFKFEFLGVLFFGMMIQRVFDQIARTTVDTFQKIAQGQSEASQALIGLSAGFEFLKFSVGEAIGTALMPYLDTILNLISVVADFITQHPQLTAGVIGFGLAAGTVLMTVGQLVLGLFSLNMAFGPMIGSITKIIPLAGSLGLSLGPILLIVGAIAAAVILLYLAWQNNWFNIREVFAQVWNFLQPAIQFFTDLVLFLGKVFWEVFQIMAKVVQIFWGIVMIPFNLLRGFLEGLGIDLSFLDDLWNTFWKGASAALEIAWAIIKPIFEAIKGFLDWIIGGIDQVNKGARDIGKGVGASVAGKAPALQGGGTISRTGMALVHRGETVTPAGSSMGDINVTVNTGPVGSDVDVEALADRVGDVIAEKVRASVNPAVTKFLR